MSPKVSNKIENKPVNIEFIFYSCWQHSYKPATPKKYMLYNIYNI